MLCSPSLLRGVAVWGLACPLRTARRRPGHCEALWEKRADQSSCVCWGGVAPKSWDRRGVPWPSLHRKPLGSADVSVAGSHSPAVPEVTCPSVLLWPFSSPAFRLGFLLCGGPRSSGVLPGLRGSHRALVLFRCSGRVLRRSPSFCCVTCLHTVMAVGDRAGDRGSWVTCCLWCGGWPAPHRVVKG